MMTSGHRLWLGAMAVGLACWSATAQQPAQPAKPAPAPPAPVANTVAATVNGKAIYEIAVQRGLKRVPPDKHAQARPEILTYLIDNNLIDQYMQLQQVVVDAKEADARVEQIKAEVQKAGQEFGKMLGELMLTEAELKQQIMADLRWEKFAISQATDQALRDLFTQNLDMFDGSMVHARHILLMSPAGDPKALAQIKLEIEKQVAEGLAKLPAGADALTREKLRTKLLEDAFAAKAREKSNCPSKEQGGDVGSFPRAGSMVEPFAKTAFALKPYQMSDVVTTQFGHHLILVIERKPGKPVKFEEVKEEVREVFFDQLRERLASQLRQKAQIAVSPPPKQ